MSRATSHSQTASASPPVEAMDAVLASARSAQPAWAQTPVQDRLAILRRFRHLLAEHAEEIANTVRRPIAETLTSQILPLADHVAFLERHAAHALKPKRLGLAGRPAWLFGTRTRIDREPLGVVLILAPSNYPLFIPGTQLVQALAAGNAVLLKPSAQGQPAALALARLLGEAGLLPNLVAILPANDDSAAAAVRAGPDKILLTGSSETGRRVLSAATERLTPCTLELSGSDAVFVRADADLDRVVSALRFGLCLNDGATCIAPRRVFVHRSVFRPLEQRLRTAFEQTPPIPMDPRQAARLRPLHDHACHHGANPLWPAHLDWNKPRGPIIVSDAAPAMPLLEAELFAPVLALVPVDNDEEAIAAAAQCPYALGASIFSADEAAAQTLAKRVDAGVVTLNDLIVPTADPRIPFGGRHASGYGVTRGIEGLLELTRVKVVASRRGRWLPHLEAPVDGDAAFFASALRASHGASVGGRLLSMLRTARLAILRGRAKRKPVRESPPHSSERS